MTTSKESWMGKGRKTAKKPHRITTTKTTEAEAAIMEETSTSTNSSKGNVLILVLGDIGRSPRMQYHAASFASSGYHVDLVGYQGTTPIASVKDNDKIRINYLTELWRPRPGAPRAAYLAYAPFKIFLQFFQLLFLLLLYTNSPDYILVQVTLSVGVAEGRVVGVESTSHSNSGPGSIGGMDQKSQVDYRLA